MRNAYATPTVDHDALRRYAKARVGEITVIHRHPHSVVCDCAERGEVVEGTDGRSR